MLNLKVEHQNGEVMHRSLQVPFMIGRQAPAELLLKGWRIAKQHAELLRIANDYFIKDLGSLSGTMVNGVRITEYGPLQPSDTVVIGPCQIHILSTTFADNVGDERPVAIPDTEASFEAIQQEDPPLSVTVAKKEPEFSSIDGADPYVSYIGPLHHKLVNALDLRRKNYRSEAVDSLRAQAERCLVDLIDSEPDLAPALCRTTLSERVVDEALGLGPLELLLRDDSISEVMVNSPSEVFVERAGRCERSTLQFSSETALLAVIDRIVSPLGRRIDESSPMVDARLPDGSRVNAVVAPIALKGPTLTVRKFPRNRLAGGDLLAKGAMSSAMLAFLKVCVEHKKNILVSGGTGSGKTTLLNVLTDFIGSSERIITIEDAAELKLEHANVVTLEARPANVEGKGLISIRDLVRNALRMRPDRIVVGECRGGEAFDMLAAMNTGHEGSMTTLHANSPREAMNRLETLIMLAGMDLPLTVVRDHISASINIIVQQSRLNNGRRVVSSITEICGQESGRILLQELFHAKEHEGDRVEFNANGLFPQSFEAQANELCSEWFTAKTLA